MKIPFHILEKQNNDLQQDLEAKVDIGSPFLAPPGLIVIPELTLCAMENAIEQLWKQGYFDAQQAEAPKWKSLIRWRNFMLLQL